ncbi:MAG: hypothetical protein M3Z00_02530 [Actinomycetota bacterium]|nr:hypothetical protein [Actinomycetota bacterium]
MTSASARTAVRTLPTQLHGQDREAAAAPPRKALKPGNAAVPAEHRYANAGPDCYWELPSLKRLARG